MTGLHPGRGARFLATWSRGAAPKTRGPGIANDPSTPPGCRTDCLTGGDTSADLMNREVEWVETRVSIGSGCFLLYYLRPLHNTPSAASLSRFGLGHVREHTPFALTLSSLHLRYSAKSLPKKHSFFGRDHFAKVLSVAFAVGGVSKCPMDRRSI